MTLIPLVSAWTALTLGVAAPAAPGPTRDEPCGAWNTSFGVPGTTDIGSTVLGGSYVSDLLVFDLGGGPSLVAAGEISIAGDTRACNVARWNGAGWSALGAGLDHRVESLLAFDDGSGAGTRLLAGGGFRHSGDVDANGVAVWNGGGWEPLAGDTPGLTVYDLVAFDDGSGPTLHAAAGLEAGGELQSLVLRWNGSGWQRVGGPMNATVRSLEVFDDGSGPRLFAGGDFTTAGGLAVNGVARWNGTDWTALAGGSATGVGGTVARVDELRTLDLGTGPALHVGGRFETAGGAPATNIARWDGQDWSPLGSGLGGGAPTHVRALTVFDEGAGPRLFAAGRFFVPTGTGRHVARWDGTAWSAVGSGVDGTSATVNALSAFDDGSGSGSALFAGGDFAFAGRSVAHDVARWDAGDWSAVAGPGRQGLGGAFDTHVAALAVIDEPSAPTRVVAGGTFTTAGPEPSRQIAEWNGTSWRALGAGVDGGTVSALIHFDDGQGTALFVGGSFTSAGGVPADHVARWDGQRWSALPGYQGAAVHAFAEYEDPAGGAPTLLAAGAGVGLWDGAGWSGLGSLSDPVLALAEFDDGTGPSLYAGGALSSSAGAPLGGIARWDGSDWVPVGGGLDHPAGPPVVHALTVFDDGSGPALYAAGIFETAGGSPARHLARWDGQSWSPVGGGLAAAATCMTVHRGSLVVGGTFLAAGSTPVRRLASWDGTGWSALGGGLDDAPSTLAGIQGSNAPPTLFIGGRFTSAGRVASARFAAWESSCECPPVARCSAKVNSLGCLPRLESSGFASLTDPAPFEMRATGVLNNRRGAFVFGLGGPRNSPWLGGTLCVGEPLLRGPMLDSGGHPAPLDCSGEFRFDFNAWVQSAPPAGLLAGTRVDAQLWYHDPGAVGRLGMTNALAFWVCP